VFRVSPKNAICFAHLIVIGSVMLIISAEGKDKAISVTGHEEP
jgi:hypothetical protein